MSDASAATKKCPYCAETILAEAIKCRYCGSDLSGPAFPKSVAEVQPIAQPAYQQPAQAARQGGINRKGLAGVFVGFLLLMCVLCGIVSAMNRAANPSTVNRSTPTRASQTQSGVAALNTTAKPVATDAPTAIPPTKTMIPVQQGTKDNPAPWNTALTLDGNKFMITSVRFGVDAEIEAANMFNKSPEAGQQYIEVTISTECVSDKCIISPYDFEVVGTKGIVYDVQGFLTGVDGMLEQTEYLQGAKLEGKKIYFIIDASDSNLAMHWTRMLSLADGYFDIN